MKINVREPITLKTISKDEYNLCLEAVLKLGLGWRVAQYVNANIQSESDDAERLSLAVMGARLLWAELGLPEIEGTYVPYSDGLVFEWSVTIPAGEYGDESVTESIRRRLAVGLNNHGLESAHLVEEAIRSDFEYESVPWDGWKITHIEIRPEVMFPWLCVTIANFNLRKNIVVMMNPKGEPEFYCNIAENPIWFDRVKNAVESPATTVSSEKVMIGKSLPPKKYIVAETVSFSSCEPKGESEFKFNTMISLGILPQRWAFTSQKRHAKKFREYAEFLWQNLCFPPIRGTDGMFDVTIPKGTYCLST